MRRLQVLQNTILRLETGLGWYTHTEVLVKKSNHLSVHQLVAYHSALQVFKCKRTSQPEHMFNRLFVNNNNRGGLRSVTQDNTTTINFDLSLARGSFFYRASRIYNSLPDNIKNCETIPTFKRLLKRWTKENISIVP